VCSSDLPQIPIEVETLTPDAFLGKSPLEISALPAICGNQEACLGDFFAVAEDGRPDIVVEGDLQRVKMIGAGMTQGRIIVEGSAGMHLGAGMSGGSIIVNGNVADWAGAEMRGGSIHIHGNAGDVLGGAYRGGPKGMNRGVIIVDGNAGNEAGSTMRRGLMVIGGDTGNYPGAFMIAGTILVMGRLGECPGAALKRGTLIGFKPATLLSSYKYSCTYTASYVDLLLRHIASLGVEIPAPYRGGRFRRYCGDMVALGKGEILLWDEG
jgi:formylmethanofuran dehydrogenase subunit C